MDKIILGNMNFLLKKNFKMFVLIKDSDFYSKIFKKVDVGQSHGTSILNKFESHNFITTKKIGRKRIISLTKKGLEIQKTIRSILDEINKNN